MDARDFNNIETRAVIKSLFLRGKVPKEIHAILTETLAKDLSAPLYWCRGVEIQLHSFFLFRFSSLNFLTPYSITILADVNKS